MKKIIIAVIVVFGITSLVWAEPPVKQVEVTNPSLNVKFDQPVDVNVTNEPSPQEVYANDPIPVSITDESAKKSVISKFMEILDTRTNYIIMTVPTDKEFILTDIIATPITGVFDFSVKEYINEPPWDYVTKIRVKSGYINLTSGIFFSLLTPRIIDPANPAVV